MIAMQNTQVHQQLLQSTTGYRPSLRDYGLLNNGIKAGLYSIYLKFSYPRSDVEFSAWFGWIGAVIIYILKPSPYVDRTLIKKAYTQS